MKTASVFTLFGAVCCALALQACDPQAFSMNVEMRYPSASGLNLDGKSVAVVYLQNEKRDSVFNEYLVNGFASLIEKEYFRGEEAVALYKMDKDPAGHYASSDTLINLVVDTGSDVVFLFDAPDFGDVSVTEKQKTSRGEEYYVATVPVKIRLYAFDSLSGSDSVSVWNGSRKLARNISADNKVTRSEVAEKVWDELALPAEQLGNTSARTFSPSWKEEQYTFVYYESPDAWISAVQNASDYKWQDAIKIWMTLVNSKNSVKRSCAEYNIATACYLLGDNELALKWLEQSDKDYPISLSSSLRKRINSRLN
ncbi:MAG: DUF6340 family protein [Bacteroidales bacterium]|nr:DUF6340 family protein [Bacteroidales bacterium]